MLFDVFGNIGLGLSVAASIQNLAYCAIGALLGTSSACCPASAR